MGGRSVRSITRAISWWWPLPALVSSIAACATTPGDHYAVYIDASLDDRVQEVVAALEDWETATHVSFHITVVSGSCPDGSHSICIRPATRDEVDDFCGYQRGATLDGCTAYHGSSDSALTEIVADRPLNIFRDGVRHEIGHALGLHHEPQHPSAVMYPSDNGRRLRVTCYDVAQFDEVRGRTSTPCPPDPVD